MTDLTVGLITILGTVASVSGIVAYVFNGTRSLIKEMHAGTMEMQRQAEQRHREIMELLKQQHQDHQDIVELLKKGFGVAST